MHPALDYCPVRQLRVCIAIPSARPPHYSPIGAWLQLAPQDLLRPWLSESQDHSPMALLDRISEGENPEITIAQHYRICRQPLQGFIGQLPLAHSLVAIHRSPSRSQCQSAEYI